MSTKRISYSDSEGNRLVGGPTGGGGGGVDWLSLQIARAQALGLGVDSAPYYEDFGPLPIVNGQPVPPAGEFTNSDRTTYALFQDGAITKLPQYPSGVFLIDAVGPTPGSLAFAWSVQATGVLNTADWYAASRVLADGIGDASTVRTLVSGFLNWDFVAFAMLVEVNGGYSLSLRNEAGPSFATSGGVCDLTAAHDYAIGYSRATDVCVAYCDGLPIPGLDAIQNAGQYMPANPANQGGASIGVWGGGSSPVLADKLAFITGSLVSAGGG